MRVEIGANTADWLSVVRRARLGRTVKAVAFAVAGYANNDGTKVFPGIARLSVECELSAKVVKEAMSKLREAGLLEVVRPARRPGEANECRLVLAEGLLDRVDVPTPAAHEMAIRHVSASIRGRYKPKHLQGTAFPADGDGLQGTAIAAEETEHCESAGYGTDRRTEPAGYGEDDLRGTAYPPTSHGPLQSSTSQNGRDIRTDPEVARASEPVQRCDGCIDGYVVIGDRLGRCICFPNVIPFPSRGEVA